MENSAKNRARILLVEDHASFRQALAFMFEREPEFTVVRQAGSISEARGSLDGVDVAVVDLGLSDGDGTALIEELSKSEPRVMTLVLSATLDPAVLPARWRPAHRVCCTRPSPYRTSWMRYGGSRPVRLCCLRTRSWRCSAWWAGSARGRSRPRDPSSERLTRRELEVLRALAEGMDSQKISRRLGITIETERTHMVNILSKLGLRSRLQALVFAVRHDLVEIR